MHGLFWLAGRGAGRWRPHSNPVAMIVAFPPRLCFWPTMKSDVHTPTQTEALVRERSACMKKGKREKREKLGKREKKKPKGPRQKGCCRSGDLRWVQHKRVNNGATMDLKRFGRAFLERQFLCFLPASFLLHLFLPSSSEAHSITSAIAYLLSGFFCFVFFGLTVRGSPRCLLFSFCSCSSSYPVPNQPL